MMARSPKTMNLIASSTICHLLVKCHKRDSHSAECGLRGRLAHGRFLAVQKCPATLSVHMLELCSGAS